MGFNFFLSGLSFREGYKIMLQNNILKLTLLFRHVTNCLEVSCELQNSFSVQPPLQHKPHLSS